MYCLFYSAKFEDTKEVIRQYNDQKRRHREKQWSRKHHTEHQRRSNMNITQNRKWTQVYLSRSCSTTGTRCVAVTIFTKTPTLTSQSRSELFYEMVSLVTYIFAGISRAVYTSFHRRGRCNPFFNSTSTIDDCQHECTNTSDCRGLTYDKSTLNCLLHDCPGTMDPGNTNITYYKKWSTCK